MATVMLSKFKIGGINFLDMDFQNDGFFLSCYCGNRRTKLFEKSTYA